MTSQIKQQDSNVQGHLPECFMAARLGVDTYAPDVLAQMKRAGCICDRLRACEERVSRQPRHVCPDNNCCMGDPHD